jgi:hypothetical protein
LKKKLEEQVIQNTQHHLDLNVTTSVKNSLARKIGIKSIFDKKIKELEEELENN